ncbi:MAG: 16S rRNA (guanine(527)-N(7))-methyltransferase RsmG [Alphaproteobacteria bacterium]|nr:16S rRNA (guanine(527)-N(7))-methyltransferase RsmG [Alphaproteobacteria bacterium]
MEKLECKYTVSRETMDRLKAYEASLYEWQNRMNLVSKNSLENAWKRHFQDSMQLFSLLPQQGIVYDFGSGAGFPGMVLAVMSVEKTPYLKFRLVESIKKKTLYLNEVKKITGISNVEILNKRIEDIPAEAADVITSRAMASLSDLLKYAQKFCTRKTKCIFLKGKSYADEIAEAKKIWKFNAEVLPSQESDEGVILIITDIHKRR